MVIIPISLCQVSRQKGWLAFQQTADKYPPRE